MYSINTIKFGILGDADIKKMSVALINNPSLKELPGTVYDPGLGCTNLQAVCNTCEKDIWSCPGHFGHIALGCQVILFWKETVKFLKCFCFNCKRILAEVNTRFDAGVALLGKQSDCAFCGTKTYDYKLIFTDKIFIQQKCKKPATVRKLDVAEIADFFDQILDDDLKMLGIDPQRTHPRNLILTLFPVLPICCRPKVSIGDAFYDDDLSISLSQIIKLTWKLKQAPDEAKEAAVTQLQLKLLYYCNNSKGRDVHSTNNKVMVGIGERISKKTGLIRQNIMGKRSDYTARSVVGPHPFLELDQVAVPNDIADNLTVPERVTLFNKDKLYQIVMAKKAPFIVRKSGVKISVDRFLKLGSTVLQHGDLVDGEKVYDCNRAVRAGAVVTRAGESFVYKHVTNKIELQVGDIVHRLLQDDDAIVLNRQPTLHKNSMMGMRVKRWSGKTICVNLAITAGFNMDFDGDEGNLNLPQSPEAIAEVKQLMNAKNHIISSQSNKASIVIVQDSLLGAYLMTKNNVQMTRQEFFDCLFCIDHNYPLERAESFTSRQLWNFLFPPNFHYNQKNICIRYGKLVSGWITKSHLKSGANSLIRIIYLEYGKDFTNTFVTNIQRLVTTWLTLFPHSVSVKDCLIDADTKLQIALATDKYIKEADSAARITNSHIREQQINAALNNAKDIGNRIAKDHLSPSNRLAAMVESGSKGDYFNLSQIMGLLGQQNIAGARIKKEIDNKFRSLPYYPRVMFGAESYEAQGFVRSSFIKGLNPRELFFHTKAGREGMIDTSHRTGTTGYMERKMIKIAEDLTIHYDATVRDGRKNIIQWIYGDYGFDPTTTTKDNVPIPVDPQRLAQRLEFDAQDHLDKSFIRQLLSQLNIGSETTPNFIRKKFLDRLCKQLEIRLNDCKLSRCNYDVFKKLFTEKFYSQIIAPGEPVGIIAAQSIGEQQTQQMLNTFHTTGKLRSEEGRLTEILNMAKLVKNTFSKMYFNKMLEPDAIRFLMRNVVYTSVADVTKSWYKDNDKIVLTLDVCKLYAQRIFTHDIAEKLAGVEVDRQTIEFTSFDKWDAVHISGIKNIVDYTLEYDSEKSEWYVFVEGNNIPQLLSLDFIDPKRFYTNNLWSVYETLGIGAVREQILAELQTHCVTNKCHLTLMADLMTFRGRPMALDRYTMRQSTVGPLSKATFEESMDILTAAAIKTDVETNCGVSASIMVGNRIRMGTGFMDLKYKL